MQNPNSASNIHPATLFTSTSSSHQFEAKRRLNGIDDDQSPHDGGSTSGSILNTGGGRREPRITGIGQTLI